MVLDFLRTAFRVRRPTMFHHGRRLPCARCVDGTLVQKRLYHAPVVRVVGYLLCGDAVLTVLLAAAGDATRSVFELRLLLSAGLLAAIGWLMMRKRPAWTCDTCGWVREEPSRTRPRLSLLRRVRA
jgi:hypothetical protein